MKMMTRMMAMLMAALMCLCATASAETVLKLGTTVNEQDSFQVAAEKFAELVEAVLTRSRSIPTAPWAAKPKCWTT